MRLIDADMLCKYCDNNINHSITPNEIMRMPYINAEPVKHGKWETHDVVKTLASGKTLDGFCQCSECGDIFDYCFSNYKYCPNCGAIMYIKDGESK